MVNQHAVEDSGHSNKVATVKKKHCHYYLFDRLPHTLKNSAAVQEYLAVELGLRKSYILVGSRLPRGGWESWVDKGDCVESVIKLPRGGRGTRRPDQQPITHAKTCSEDQDQDQQQRGCQAPSENFDQVPFNESEWAVNALLHLLQHPDIRVRIKALLVDTLLGCLPKPLNTRGRPGSRPRTFGSKFKSSGEQSIMFEIREIPTPIAQYVRRAAMKPSGYKIECRSEQSFPEIVKNEKTKRRQECFAELILEPNGPSFASQKCTGGANTEFIACKASMMIPSKSTLAENGEKASEDSSNADAAVCEHEQSPSHDEEIELDWTKEALTFKWYEEPETGIGSAQLKTTPI